MRKIALLLSLLILSACAGHRPHRPSGNETAPARTKWVRQLESESERRPLIAFGSTGEVSAIAGAFALPDRSSSAAANWLLAHREMFGLKSDDMLALAKGGGSTDEGSVETEPRRAYLFDVMHQGYPHSGMQITTTIVGERPLLVGIFNSYAATLNPRQTAKFLREESAWAAAEAKFGTALTHVEAVRTWFDVSWALNRVPGTQELHWRLLGLDAGGAPQYAFVRASDNRVSYYTPLVTKFSVHQTDLDRANNVLWDNRRVPNGCVAGDAGCTGIALAESMRSRDIFPKVVDLWYTLSSPGGPAPFVWPFSGLNRAPFDNQGERAIRVVVANPPKVGLNIADVPSRDGSISTYNFPEGTITLGYVGHEYGHVLLGQLKHVHPGAAGASPFSPPASFTEGMADFIGIVTEHRVTGAIPPPPSAAHWMTDFSIGDFKYGTNGGVIDSPPVAWDIREGNCSGRGRERLGRAFINAWGWDVQWFGDRPHAVGEATYRAWWIDIMRSFALLPEFGFPTIKDFYDATVSRNFLYATPEERLPALFLKTEMEKLGLDAPGCF